MNTLWKGIRNEIKCDSLRATDIYGNIHGPTSNNIPAGITGATGYFGYFHSITGQINNFYSYTGDIDTLYSNTIYAATGEIGTLYSNTIYANTGDIGTLISDRIYAATGIYSASSFTRDQSTDITVPNISSMYQYYAAGPVTIPVLNQGFVFLNRSSLTGMTGTKGTLIPASAFSVGSLFEFYFAGSFTNNGFSDATNLVTGSVTTTLAGLVVGKVYLNSLSNPTQIKLISNSPVFNFNAGASGYNSKLFRIQSIYQPNNPYKVYNYQLLNITNYSPSTSSGVTTYTFSVVYNAALNSISINNFSEGDDVIVKFEDSDGPSVNISLTFEENEADYDADKAICTINLENTIYYKQKHHFTSKSIFNINDINSNTISISSSNSGSIYCHNGNEGDFISNANTLYKPFNTFDKSYNKTFPFTKNPSNSNTVYPRISVSSFAQNINLEVNNYYLRRIA